MSEISYSTIYAYTIHIILFVYAKRSCLFLYFYICKFFCWFVIVCRIGLSNISEFVGGGGPSDPTPYFLASFLKQHAKTFSLLLIEVIIMRGNRKIDMNFL